MNPTIYSQKSANNIIADPKGDKNDNNNESCWRKNKKILLAILIPSIVLIVLVVLLCVFLIKKKEKEEEYEHHFYVIGTYKAEKGVPLKLFNPSKIGLKEENYTVEEITQVGNKRKKKRKLQQINITDGIYIPDKDEKIQIKITFNESLTTLDFMFEGCDSLIKIDFTGLNSPNVTSMIYTFTNCEQLQTVDFTYFQSSNIEKMDFLFSGCSNLVNINGFENLNTSSLIKTAGMFLGCTSLISLNLSSLNFNNISEQNGMFVNNPSLESIDLGEVSDINDLFSSSEEFHVNIITSSDYINSSGLSGTFEVISREENDNLNCSLRNYSFIFDDFSEKEEYIIKYYDNFYITQSVLDSSINFKDFPFYFIVIYGFDVSLSEIEKCTECDEGNRRKYCKNCRIGTYLPKGIDYSQKRCRRCEEGCIKCIADEETDESICLTCENENNLYPFSNEDDYYYNYSHYYNNSYYDKFYNEDGTYYFFDDYIYFHQFKNGYYHDYILSNYVYTLKNGKCIKRCKIGKGNRCKSCNLEEGKNGQCFSCNDGYYFDENINETICQKINIENCVQAVIESDTIKCTNCTKGYILENGACVKACNIGYGNYLCATCNQTYENRDSCASCYPSYYLTQDSENENKMTCMKCSEVKEYCSKCELDSGILKCTDCSYNSFLLNGECIISCNYSTCLSCVYENNKYTCGECKENYYLKVVDGMKYCEKCPEVCQACLDNNTCTKCIDGYKLENGKCEFYCQIGSISNCNSCDYNEKYKCKECYYGYFLLDGETNNCIYCGSNCASCTGQKNNPICTQCNYGYKLIDGKCIKQCNLGYNWDYCKTCDTNNPSYCGSCFEGYYISSYYKSYCSYCGSYKIKQCHQSSDGNIIVDECYSDYILLNNQCVEKCDTSKYWLYCLVCNEEEDQIDQCKQCKDGYYLPYDTKQKSYCYSCPNSCKSCEGSYYNPTCTECREGYTLSGGKCLKECIKGGGNKCKSCKTEEGKIDQCLECNDGYYLETYDDYFNYYNSHSYCLPCPNNCIKCQYNGYNADCTECDNGYHLVKQEYNQYYYYYDPIIYNKCEECSIPGCLDYKQNSYKCICNSCNDGLTPIKDNSNVIISCYDGCDLGEEEKCKSCSETGKCGECNEDFDLLDGKCIGDYHLFAKYKTTTLNEKVKLVYSYTTILKMKVDGVVVNNPNYYYIFNSPGEHEVYIKFSNSISFMDLFYEIKHVTYIEFLPKAKKFDISYMNDCFYGCTNLEYVDLSNLDLTNNHCFMNFFSGDKNLKKVIFPNKPFSNIYWYYNMFKGCESLTSIDMSMIYNTNGEYFYQMFYGCKNLKFIDLSKFNKYYKGYSKYSIFYNVPKNANIIIHNNFYKAIQDQLIEYTRVINISSI